MPKYILIDLHLHSNDSTRTGSKVSGETDLEKLRILNNNNVKVACFSDHDHFYRRSYLNRLKIIKEYGFDLLLLPGLEIDLQRTDYKTGQVVIVFNPASNLEAIEEIFIGRKVRYTYAEIIEVLSGYDFMIFPHTGKAKDNMLVDDLANFQVDALDVTRDNHANVNKILSIRQIPVVSFSDTHTWKKYPQWSKKQTYVEAERNFLDIKKAIRENKIIIE
ncbi:hypothetical protein [Mycoplasma phocoeninasale]|uniref:hypothetical protein n=1 Tax=Mycoplasma phocoeninasale TaxID=2726117 RepID=UPI0019676930|nr:hypothetical protein [Mycoplasma phocoeninasale]MBN0970907.1 hypothetical protein [Mycoplasma phocoeninasale]